MKKRILSMLLALTMVLSLIPSAVFASGQAAESANPYDINDIEGVQYVAIGDSMTNGYGLYGYYPNDDEEFETREDLRYEIGASDIDSLDWAQQYGYMMDDLVQGENGHQYKASLAYPAIIAREMGWKLTNLAISGMRPAELRYLLDGEKVGDYPGDQYTVAQFADGYNLDGVYGHYDENGVKIMDDAHRFIRAFFGAEHRCATHSIDVAPCNGACYPGSNHSIKAIWNSHGGNWDVDKNIYLKDVEPATYLSACTGAALVRAEYEKYITEADVISIHMGTNNFGTVVQKKLMDILNDVANNTNPDDDKYNYDVSVEDLCKTNAELARYNAMYAKVYEVFAELLSAEHASLATEVTDALVYSMLQFVYDMDVCMEIIRKLNPNAKIIFVGLESSMKDITIVKEDGSEINLGEMGALYDFVNYYISTRPENSEAIFVDVAGMELLIESVARDQVNNVFRTKLFSGFARSLFGWGDTWGTNQGHVLGSGFKADWTGNFFYQYSDLVTMYSYPEKREEAFELLKEAAGNDVNVAALQQDLDLIMRLYELCVQSAGDSEIGMKAINLVLENGDGYGSPANPGAEYFLIQDVINNNYTPMSKDLMHLWLRLNCAEGIAVHPSEAGHEYIADEMMDALENNYTCDEFMQEESPETNALAEIYDYLDANGYITEKQIDVILNYLADCMKDTKLDDKEELGLIELIVEVLGENDEKELTDTDRVAMIGNVYTILANNGLLADYSDKLPLAEAIYAVLDPVMDDTQTVKVAKYLYGTMIKSGDELNIMDLMHFIVEVLGESNLTDEKKLELIGDVYGVLKGTEYLAKYAKELALAEALCARAEMAKITAAQTMDIVECVYAAVKANDVDARAIAKTIYFDILTVKAASSAVAGNAASGSSSSGSETELTAGDKLDIIMAVYEVLVAEDMLDETTDLKAVKDLYVTLTTEENGDQLVSDELALSIFDLVFETLVEDEDIDDQDIADVTTQVVDKLLGEESELSPEAKAAVYEKVTAALKDTSFAAPVAPSLEVIDALKAELKAAGYLTDAEIGQIIDHVYAILKTEDELTKAELADDIYTILLNKDGMTIEQKVEVLTIVYTVLDEYNYVAGGIGYAFLVAYNAAKENGYIDAAIKALDIAKAAVKLAKAEVEKFDLAEAEEVLADAKALVVEELKNIVDTMDKIQGVLATEELTPALYQELLSFEQELEKHCVTAVALARELNEALSPYVFQEVEKVVNEALAAVDFIHEIAEDAYEFVTGIPAAYDAWVESVGAKVDAISPELGALVREYLKANGDDAMAILYAYGDVAIQVLISEAVAACGDITDASINFLRVIVDNAPVMHEVIKNNAEVQALLDQLTENLKKAKAVAEWVVDNPFVAAYIASGIDQETALNAVYAELVRIHNMAYPAVMSALHAIDPYAEADVRAAYDALVSILCTTYNAADGYLGWVAEHAEAMACELLCALLENTWEFVVAASPVVDQVMYDWLYTHPYEVIEFCSENAAEIEALIEKYGPAVVGVLAYIGATYGPEVLDFIIENPCEALDMFMDWYNKYGYRIWPMIDVYLEALGVYDAIDEQLETVKAMLSELDAHILAQIAALKAALLDASEELRAQIEAEIQALYEQLMAFLKANISAYYVVGPNSYYVALGDAGAYGPAADKLAAELGMTDKYANLTFADASASEVLANLSAAAAADEFVSYAAEIAKADLITLGFGANTFTAAVAADVMNAVFGEMVEKDWAALVGEEGAAAIEAALVELTAYVAEEVEDEAIAALLTAAVESFAYTYINHLVDYVVVSEAIHEINADALLVLVGMHNPMDGVVIDLDGEQLDLGEYLNYLVMLTNIYSFGYALIAEDTIYVDAPAVETNYDGAVMDIMTFVSDLLGFEEAVVKYQPTDAGYKYIQEQIYNALNPTLAEEEACQHGAPANLKFQWAGDYSTCVAVYTCSICGEAFTKECLVEILETKQPTVEEEGYVKYQASVEIAGETYTDVQTVVLAKLPAPDTGDTTMIGLYVTVMLFAAAGAVVVLKKKKHA